MKTVLSSGPETKLGHTTSTTRIYRNSLASVIMAASRYGCITPGKALKGCNLYIGHLEEQNDWAKAAQLNANEWPAPFMKSPLQGRADLALDKPI